MLITLGGDSFDMIKFHHRFFLRSDSAISRPLGLLSQMCVLITSQFALRLGL
jgi:hypothetical protein